MTNKYAVKKKKLFEEVISHIEKMLQSGDYKIGDKLPSLTELTKIFEVGKPTLREALSVLISSGVLEVTQGSGIFIKRLTLEPEVPFLKKLEGVDLASWLEFRRGLEVEAAAIAAERRTEEDIERLEAIQQQLIKNIEEGKETSILDYEFHLQIAKSTKNPIFVEANKSSSHLEQHELFERLRQSVNIDSRKELIISEHTKIINAIKNGNSNDARQIMLKHLINAERKLKIIGGGVIKK
ncbi:FadR/GntR family transcriptional regulator [Aeromicrobium ponti]|uniref:GntR family transcriptional repressor for pyruvate dehydrogenase complex n=1 Tax=Cytobacillus oceanisediminis TaxID=665099 RepID=A0A562JS17_9BACI|nr:FadR/GntR family transcriptional regulator [Cytobacillus oceanisediminis]TWH85775.1 GntR family transcriptional repressor for pyruvate dehydrogenase complex [Cytobacillus oceanisediminis]